MPERFTGAVTEQEFEKIFRENYQLLTGYAYAILRSSDAARDIVSDVFATIWEQRTTFNPQHGIKAYLIAAVRNRAFNAIRNDARRGELWFQQVVEENEQNDSDDLNDTSINNVYDAISAMKGIRREVMILRFREQMTVPEVAAALGISTNSVSSHISQALKALRARF